MTGLREFFSTPLYKNNELSILIATFCFAAMCVYAALYYDASRCDMRRYDFASACLNHRVASHFMAKEIMNSSLPAAIKRDLLKPEVSFATGLFEEGRERPVPAIMYMNPRNAYCTGGKCIIYLFEEAENDIKFIGATLLEKNKLRMIDYFPNKKHQPSVTCEDFVGTVCVKMKPLDKTD